MSRVRVNYKSDLPPIDVTFKLNGDTVIIPEHDFLIRFFVDGAPGTSFVCGYREREDEYFNCEKKNSTTLTCYVDNHRFGCGRLCCDFIDLSPNNKYADGVQKTVTPSRLNVILVEGEGDEAQVINAAVNTDIFGVVIDLQADVELLKTDKLSYYDASWVHGEAEEHTAENFEALMDAIQAGKVIVVGDTIVGMSDIGTNAITYWYYMGQTFCTGVITRSGSTITIDEETVITLADNADVVALANRMTAVEGRMTTAEGNITNLGTRMTTAEGNITSLGSRMTTAEGNITSLGTRMTTAEGNITSLTTDKLSYYDASWIYRVPQRTEANFNALKDASLAHKVIVVNGNICVPDGETSENEVILSDFREGGYNHIVVSLVEGVVQVSFFFIVYAESAAVDTLGGRVTTAEGNITTLTTEKLSYYDASWVRGAASGHTAENFEALVAAIQSDKSILVNGHIVTIDEWGEDYVNMYYDDGYSLQYSYIYLEGGTVTIERETEDLATADDLSKIHYNANWVTDDSEHTPLNYNNLKAAIVAGKDIVMSNGEYLYHVDAEVLGYPGEPIELQYFNGGSTYTYDIELSGDTVTVTLNPSNIDARIRSAETFMTSIAVHDGADDGAKLVGYANNAYPNLPNVKAVLDAMIANTPKFFDCTDVLAGGTCTTAQYNALADAITQKKMLFSKEKVVIEALTGVDYISLYFMKIDGTTPKMKVYNISYGTPCTVSNTEITLLVDEGGSPADDPGSGGSPAVDPDRD